MIRTHGNIYSHINWTFATLAEIYISSLVSYVQELASKAWWLSLVPPLPLPRHHLSITWRPYWFPSAASWQDWWFTHCTALLHSTHHCFESSKKKADVCVLCQVAMWKVRNDWFGLAVPSAGLDSLDSGQRTPLDLKYVKLNVLRCCWN